VTVLTNKDGFAVTRSPECTSMSDASAAEARHESWLSVSPDCRVVRLAIV
jgi:hypothetical protein